MKKIIFFALPVIFAATPVFSASVKNMDSKPYELLVKQPSKAFKVVLEADGYIQELCSSCTIEVIGNSLLDVEDEKFVIVENGTLKVKE